MLHSSVGHIGRIQRFKPAAKGQEGKRIVDPRQLICNMLPKENILVTFPVCMGAISAMWCNMEGLNL